MIQFMLQEGSDYIELIKLLKAENLASSGAEAKLMVEDGLVSVNDKPEFRKRAKLYPGDTVEIGQERIQIIKFETPDK